jgi:programmed cell death 6-interacting protein
MPIPFHPVFYPKNPPITFSNLNYERACVIFNLAALFSQLASLENRATAEGIKRASGYFQVTPPSSFPSRFEANSDSILTLQSAAGTLSFLISSALKPFYSTIGDVPAPMDLTEPFLKSLEWLMLAQAQECFWQKAVMG